MEYFLERAGTYGMAIPEDTPTLAQVFSEAGCQSMAVSSSVIIRKTPSFNVFVGFDAGFLSFDETCEEKSAYCVNQAFYSALIPLKNRSLPTCTISSPILHTGHRRGTSPSGQCGLKRKTGFGREMGTSLSSGSMKAR